MAVTVVGLVLIPRNRVYVIFKEPATRLSCWAYLTASIIWPTHCPSNWLRISVN